MNCGFGNPAIQQVWKPALQKALLFRAFGQFGATLTLTRPCLEFFRRYGETPAMRPAVSSEKIYRLPFPAAQVWPVLNKTDWLNRSLGLPPLKYQLETFASGGTHRIRTTRV